MRPRKKIKIKLKPPPIAWMRENVITKLQRLEAQAPDPAAFWLTYQRYLRPEMDVKEILRFLCPDQLLDGPRPIFLTSECEFCQGEDTVVLAGDTYTCSECGSCQSTERKVFEIRPTGSAIYKHEVHMHQVLHEMMCLRGNLPDNLVADVREAVAPPYTYMKIKKSLRGLGYKQHYAMVYSIQQALDPTFKPLKLTHEQERVLQGYFYQYLKLGRLGKRKNRLNYHFVLEKLAHLTGYLNLLDYLHTPKGKKSRGEHERIWRDEVCKALGWRYTSLLD